ncbi:MAG: DUF2007 domain-containing protein, partial [Gammaproteobacteria bacterium]
RVYIAENAAMAWHVRNVLAGEGIAATVRNDQLYSLSGEVPFVDCWPEVWVSNSLDLDRSLRLIRELSQDPDSPAGDPGDWLCNNCRESSAGNFDICWSCGAARPEEG